MKLEEALRFDRWLHEALFGSSTPSRTDNASAWEARAMLADKCESELLTIQAQLVEALKGLDDSFCSINEFSTKEERHQARMNLIAARAAVSAAEAKP